MRDTLLLFAATFIGCGVINFTTVLGSRTWGGAIAVSLGAMLGCAVGMHIGGIVK